MENIGVMIVLFVLGAIMGSFACCQAWRLKRNDKSKRSHCMQCDYQLKWYDNIPIVSWLVLRGKCRKCGEKIGWMELWAEIMTGAAFVAIWAFWPWREALSAFDVVEIAKYLLFMANWVILTILLVHDAKWRELPVRLMYVSWGLAGVFLAVIFGQNIARGEQVVDLFGILGALAILPALYYLMYKRSDEKWVGGGDWMLCMPLALMLGNFWLALAVLFLANMMGCVVMLPVAIAKKNRKLRIPFGPFLIMAFLVVFLLQAKILHFVGFGVV